MQRRRFGQRSDLLTPDQLELCLEEVEAALVVAEEERIVEAALPTEALNAQVIVSKYADHLTLYWQAQIYRQGIQLDRSTLAD